MLALREGTSLPALAKGVLSTSRIARWCAAQENWDKIHYDLAYATEVAGLPGLLINGALKQHVLCQLIEAAFGSTAWLWRLEFRFVGLDLVGQGLTAGGRIDSVGRWRDLDRVEADVWITNDATGEKTTVGRATVLVPEGDRALLDATDLQDDGLNAERQAREPEPGLPEHLASKVGTVLEELTSYSVIEPGRLRLFAEAVGDVAPLHFDEIAARAARFGGVVAMPLFPIHALSRPPGERDLSVDAKAIGREGVCEVGRDFSALLGLSSTGLLNGGNRTQIHSLARAGDRVVARSELLDIKRRLGKRGGHIILFETRNDYRTDAGVPLLTEHQTTVYRDAELTH